MLKRRDERTRERERKRYEREARQTFGNTARVSLPPTSGAAPMGPMLDEARRVATVHDPQRPSGCRLCGRTVEPSGRGWSTVAGWKCCPPCTVLLPGGMGAVLSELLTETLTTAEAVEVLERMPHPSPAYFVSRWATDAGQAQRWAHLDSTLAERGREVLAELRAERSGEPRANTYGTGCAWCGVRTSARWTATPWRVGGRHGQRFASCADCEPWVDRSGARNGYGWRCHLLACCVGMRRAQMDVTYELRAFHESGADPAGTAEPWQYLGETWGKLRAQVIRAYPRLVTLTERERRVLALEQAVAAVEHPPERPPLARL